MGRPYSLDLRERVVAAMAAGTSGREAAKQYDIGKSTALRWARRTRETGSPQAKPMGGKRPFALAEQREWIVARLTEKRDLTLRALLSEVTARGAKASYFALWNLVDRAGLSFKKKRCTPASRIGLTLPAGASCGSSTRIRSIRSVWCSSMKPG